MARVGRYVVLGAAMAASLRLAVGQTNGSTTFAIIPFPDDSGNATADLPVCKDDIFLSADDVKTRTSLEGNELSVLLALPLTYAGDPVLSPGFFQLAAALMAIDHFNERNSCVVPELENIRDCPIQMDYDRLTVMDTGTIENNGMMTIIQSLRKRALPNVIVGPYNEIPAMDLSVIASSLGIPMVSHRALDHNLLFPDKHRMVTQVNPDLYSEMDFLGLYLNKTGRTDFIAVLYASSADSAVQRLEAFRGVAHKLGIENVQSFGYVSPTVPVKSRPVQTIDLAMTKLAASGYRTIVWFTPYVEEDMYAIGQAAHANGLDTGDHMWVLGSSLEMDRPQTHDGFDPKQTKEFLSLISSVMGNNMSSETLRRGGKPEEGISDMVSKLFAEASQEIDFMRFMFGSAMLRQTELLDKNSWKDSPFMKAWVQLNATFMERLLQHNPITMEDYRVEWEQVLIYSFLFDWLEPNDRPSLKFPPEDLFTNPRVFFSSPSSGCTNLYDAIMSVGLGACHAVANATAAKSRRSRNITGEMLQTGIRSVYFKGASGDVRFGDEFPGSRAGDTISYAVVNVFPNRTLQRPFVVTDYRNATDGTWRTVEPFIYADGTTSPPELLRAPGDPNYLSDGLRIAGLSLAGLAYFVLLMALLWLIAYRHHTIVIASQPRFLYCVCFGMSITTTAIVMLSFDESNGWTDDALSCACVAVPWLVTSGHLVTYNSLFTKLWRVNKVLQFSRRKVDIKHVMWPALLVEAVAFVILSVWTAITEYGWNRTVIDVTTGETMGKCGGGGTETAFLLAIVFLGLIPVLLTGIMAWKTIDVDAVYSEAKWIFALILVQGQVILVGMPLVVILEDVSTDGRYLGTVLVLWTFPMTTMGLIILPKIVAVHFPKRECRETRGSSPGVRVTGIESSITTSTRTRPSVEISSGISHAIVTQL